MNPEIKAALMQLAELLVTHPEAEAHLADNGGLSEHLADAIEGFACSDG